MNMINLDVYAMRQMRNYRLRIKFKKFLQSHDCAVTVRTTLCDAIEGYSYTEEDLEKYGASELIRHSISKFVETHKHELFTAIYNDETASLPQEIRDIIQRLKLHYEISYTTHGRYCTVWTDLFKYKKTHKYKITQSKRVMTNAKIIEDSIRMFYGYDAVDWDAIISMFDEYDFHIKYLDKSSDHMETVIISSDRSPVIGSVSIKLPICIRDMRHALEKYKFNSKEETTMRNENDVREELSSWMAAYVNKESECRKLSEDIEKLSSWIAAYENKESECRKLSEENSALKKTSKMLKDIICERDDDLRNLTKKNESLAEDIDMYQHLLMEMNVDNEKLKDEIQTRMNNEKLDAVRISDLEETVKMLRETIRGKDTTIQNDAEAFRTEIDSLNKKIDRLKADCDALNKENIRLCKKRLNEVFGADYNMRDEEIISPKLARILAVAEHFTTERDFLVWNIAKSALKGNTHHTFYTELSIDTITLLISLGYDITYNSTDHGTTIDVSWEGEDTSES